MGRTLVTFCLIVGALSRTQSASDLCRGPHCFPAQDWSRSCVGTHCQGRVETRRQIQNSAQSRHGPVYPVPGGYQQDYNQPYALHQSPAGYDGTRRTNPRTITAEVFHPGCTGGVCPTSVSQRSTGEDSARECKGIGCKLPHLMRQKPKVCVGEGCSAHEELSPVRVTDRAAQFLEEFPDFGAERGAWIQLNCDMKPSGNEVPSEDALVLQLQLSKGQEKLVEALRGQQDEVRELQRHLTEQQGALLNQQREILEQQRRMFEQMEQDRDECLEITDICGDTHKCLNTPGGFRCQGMLERDADSGMCTHGYFFNADMDECQACSECDGEPIAAPCSFTTDTVCSGLLSGASALSLAWAGDISLSSEKGHILTHVPSLQLQIQGRSEAGLLSAEAGHLIFRQHGLVWLDQNLPVSHGCRSFIQVCLRMNSSDGAESSDLSGIRVEQREGRSPSKCQHQWGG
ncbi:hypothetical protein NQD34_012815 [Periophthalmus magnuspinnatus]|nr:hypothetical protein NQD34_012815 [Periophthalmus magnuspinnatus]